jgi:hypothetical protein
VDDLDTALVIAASLAAILGEPSEETPVGSGIHVVRSGTATVSDFAVG